jgi:hypothetical protein
MSELVDAMRTTMDRWIAEGTEDAWQDYRMACDAYLDSDEQKALRKRINDSETIKGV